MLMMIVFVLCTADNDFVYMLFVICTVVVCMQHLRKKNKLGATRRTAHWSRYSPTIISMIPIAMPRLCVRLHQVRDVADALLSPAPKATTSMHSSPRSSNAALLGWEPHIRRRLGATHSSRLGATHSNGIRIVPFS